MKESKSKEQIEEEKRQIEILCRRIQNLSAKIPAKMNEWSYQRAVEFKQVAMQALRQAEASRPNLQKLQQACANLSNFY